MARTRHPWLRIALVLAAATTLILLRIRLWPEAGTGGIQETVDQAGAWAPAAILAAYILGTSSFLPITLLNLAAGALLPLPSALLWSYVGTLAAAQAQFWLAQTTGPHLRDLLERRVPGAVGHLETRRLPVLLTLRLVPVFPFAPTNYALSLGRIPWRSYTLTGVVGHVPGTVVTVFVGAALLGFDAGFGKFWLLIGGLVAALAVLGGLVWFLLVRYGRREWVK